MNKVKFLLFLFALALLASCKTKEPEVIGFDQENYQVNVGDSILIKVRYSSSDLSIANLLVQLGDTKIAKLSDYLGDFSYYVKGLQVGTTQLTARGKESEAKCNIIVGRIPLEKITLTDTLRLKVDESDTVKCSLTPENTTDIIYSWKSNNEKIAKVDANGIVTAVKIGETDVVFSEAISGKSAKCHIIVLPVPVDSISSGEMNILNGDTVKLKYKVYPANASNDSVTITSDDPSIVEVKNDTLIALAYGDANITLTSKDGGHTSTYVVHVTEIDAFVTFDLTGELGLSEEQVTIANVTMLLKTNHKDSIQLNKIELWNPMSESVWSQAKDTTLVEFEYIYKSEQFLMKGNELDMTGWKCKANYTWRSNIYTEEIELGGTE